MNIQEICEYILNNINTDINVEQIADYFHYNKSYMMRKFKDYTGFTINEFINECRVYKSTNPLIYTNYSILKIALTNGFNSLEYYSEKFKDIIGTPPLRFRQIYTSLLEIANNSNSSKELKIIKESLSQLEEYREYLYSIGNIASNEKQNYTSKPKVKTLNIINPNTK